MAKVYIDLDTGSHFFMWDSEMLDILPQPEHLLQYVPDELLAKYQFVTNLYAKVQEELRPYYESKYSIKKA